MLFEEMGFDAEVVRVRAWKGFVCLVNVTAMAIALFVSVSCRCVKRQPCVSATLFLLLLLYVCYPLVFWVLVYSSFVVACIYIVLGKNLCSRFYEQQVVKHEENRTGMSSEKLSSALGDRTFKLNGKTILSRRSRKRIILQSADSNDPTNQLFTMLANPLKFEERKMDIIWGGDHSSLNSPLVDELCSPTGDQLDSDQFVLNSGFVPCDGSSESLQTDRDCDHGHFEPKSPIDDEDATLDANKGVEWTEDGQKNLMDLGNSDIERNKRLESLMAKRRVKKLLSMQLQREPTNFNVDALSTIAPLAIAKSNMLFSPTAVHGSEKLPGSAPSVLVPMRNPFDLPYDPQEERPNLTGDSFDQEFLLADQRDLNLLGHESSDLQSMFNGEPKNTTEKQESEGLSCSTFKLHQDKEPHEKLFQASLSIVDESISTITNDVKVSGQKEQISPARFEKLKVEGNEKSENMILSVCAREPDKVEDYAESKLADSLGIQTESTSGGSVRSFSTLYSPSEDEVDNCDQDEVLNGPDGSVSKAFIDSLRKSLIRSRSRIIARGMTECLPVNQSVSDPDSSPIENTTMVDIQCQEKQNQAARTPRHSIASDLRVEVSDSSPPLSVGTISPPDGEFLVYGADIEQEMTFGSEDMWGASSHLSAVEENESRSRVVHEISEYDIIGLGFYEINQSAKDLTLSEMSPKKVERQDSTTRSSLALGTDRSTEGHAPPASITKNILDETSQDVVRMPLSHIATDETIEKNLASSLDCGNTQESAKPVANGDSAKEVCDPLLKCNGMSDIIQNGTHTVTVHGIEQASGDNDNFSRRHLSKADKESPTFVNVKSHSGGPEVLENIQVQHPHDRLEEYRMEIPISMQGVGEELKDMIKCIPAYNFAKLDELNILAEDEITSKGDKNLGVHLVEEGLAKETDAGLQVVEIESEVFTKVNPIINLSMPEDGHIVQNDNANVKAKWEDSIEPKVAEKDPSNESEGLAKGEPEVVPANFSEASNVQNGDGKAKVDENIDEKLVEDGQSKHLIADAFAEPSKLKEAGIAEGSNEIKIYETEGSIEQKSVERRCSSKEMKTTISMQDVGGEAKDFIIGGPLENNLSNALCPLKEVEVTTAQGCVGGELQGLLRIEY